MFFIMKINYRKKINPMKFQNKKIMFMILFVPSLVFANPSSCISSIELIGLMDEYKELPYVRGVTSEGRSVVVFANPTTGSFTILERRGENTFCALAVGAGFEPVPKSIQDEMRESQNKGTL